jgi:hypothetical protein
VVLVELSEGGVVGLDEFVSWLEAGLLGTRHGGVLAENPARVQGECQHANATTQVVARS